MAQADWCFTKTYTSNYYQFLGGHLLPPWLAEDARAVAKLHAAGLVETLDHPRIRYLRGAKGMPIDAPSVDELAGLHGKWMRPKSAWWSAELEDAARYEGRRYVEAANELGQAERALFKLQPGRCSLDPNDRERRTQETERRIAELKPEIAAHKAWVESCRVLDNSIRVSKSPEAEELRGMFRQLSQAESRLRAFEDGQLRATNNLSTRAVLDVEADRQRAEVAELRERIMAAGEKIGATKND